MSTVTSREVESRSEGMGGRKWERRQAKGEPYKNLALALPFHTNIDTVSRNWGTHKCLSVCVCACNWSSATARGVN